MKWAEIGGLHCEMNLYMVISGHGTPVDQWSGLSLELSRVLHSECYCRGQRFWTFRFDFEQFPQGFLNDFWVFPEPPSIFPDLVSKNFQTFGFNSELDGY